MFFYFKKILPIRQETPHRYAGFLNFSFKLNCHLTITVDYKLILKQNYAFS